MTSSSEIPERLDKSETGLPSRESLPESSKIKRVIGKAFFQIRKITEYTDYLEDFLDEFEGKTGAELADAIEAFKSNHEKMASLHYKLMYLEESNAEAYELILKRLKDLGLN